METKVMRVNSKGMVTIPKELRKKYRIKEGSEVAIIEVNGEIQLLPILELNEMRTLLPSRAAMKEIYMEAQATELELEKQHSEISSSRKSMVKSGDRSEKIRTYNYPQNRVTDHRLEGEAKNYTLREVVEGGLQPIIENLKIAERAAILKQEVV